MLPSHSDHRQKEVGKRRETRIAQKGYGEREYKKRGHKGEKRALYLPYTHASSLIRQ